MTEGLDSVCGENGSVFTICIDECDGGVIDHNETEYTVKGAVLQRLLKRSLFNSNLTCVSYCRHSEMHPKREG